MHLENVEHSRPVLVSWEMREIAEKQILMRVFSVCHILPASEGGHSEVDFSSLPFKTRLRESDPRLVPGCVYS